MTWPKMTIGGVEYDLEHLRPMTIQVKPKAEDAPTYIVRITFGLHTFSREFRESDSAAEMINSNGETRCFCPTRYDCSLSLPSIMNAAATGKAHFSQGANFLLVRNLATHNAPYAIFFDVQKAKIAEADVAMFVTSAYLKPELPKNLPTVTFATLIGHTARGLKVTRPKK